MDKVDLNRRRPGAAISRQRDINLKANGLPQMTQPAQEKTKMKKNRLIILPAAWRMKGRGIFIFVVGRMISKRKFNSASQEEIFIGQMEI